MRFALLITLLAATGCGSIIGPEYTLPPDAVPVAPGESYALWYAQAEACAGVDGDFAAVRWFEVPGERWWDPLRQQYAIATWRHPHDIYITTANLDDEYVVKHEVIHDLLQGGASNDSRFGECSHITH
jgi:predicted small lipoprotein YifL